MWNISRLIGALSSDHAVKSAAARWAIETLERRLFLTAIASGQTIDASLVTTAEKDSYTFSAPAGSSFEVSLGDANSISAVEPYLTINGPTGAYVNQAYTNLTNTSVNVIYTVPSTSGGTFTAIVQDYNGAHIGAYALELAVAPAVQQPDADGDGGVILSGQTKTGTINRTGDIDVYTFSAAAGNSFELSLGDASSTSAVEPNLLIYGPTGAYVNQAYTNQTNTSVNVTYTVPSTSGGTFTAIVQDYNGSHTGAYAVELAVAPAVQQSDADGDGGVILSGQTRTGTINRTGDIDVYTFAAAPGNSLELSLGDTNSTSAVEANLLLYGPTGTYLNQSDTNQTNTSVDLTYTVPTTSGGTYTAIVQDYNGTHTGAYALELAVAPAVQQPDADGDGGVILSGQTKTGTINRTGDIDVFTFSAAAGNNFELSLGDSNSTSVMEPNLVLYGPTGTYLNQSSTNVNNTSVNLTYTVPATSGGTYTAIAQDYSGTHTGAYALELIVAPAVQATDADGDGGKILSGQTKSGTINRTGDIDAFTFSATAGNSFELSLGDANSTSAVDPYLAIYGPTGALVNYSQVNHADTSVNISYTVPATSGGLYTAIVQDYTGKNTGAYDLELAVAPATQAADLDGDGGVIVSGQTQSGSINRAGDIDVFTFSAGAGNSFELSLGDASSTSAVDPYLAIYGPTGSLVNYAQVNHANTSVNISYTVPSTSGGKFTAIVQDYTGADTGSYDVELVIAPAVQAADADGDGGTITSGQTKAGTINRAGDIDVFTFSASVADSFVATLADASSASAVDPELAVYGPNGALVNYSQVNHANTSVNVSYLVPTGGAGVYTAIVQDYTGASTGGYTFNLTGATTPSLGSTTVSGRVFRDNNGNNIFDGTDTALSGVGVYLDLGNYGSYQSNDPTTTTDSNGNYSFAGLAAPETGMVRLVSPLANTVPVAADEFVANGGQTATVQVGFFSTAYSDANNGDAWIARADPNNAAELQLLLNGTVAYAVPSLALSVPNPALAFSFIGANDSLTINFSNGNPFPSAGFSLSDSSITDSTTIVGTTGNDTAFINGGSILFNSIPTNSIAALPNLSISPDGGIDSLTVAAQTVQVPAPSASGITVQTFSLLSIQGTGAELKFANSASQATRSVEVVSGLSIAGAATVDLGGNDMVVNSGTVGSLASALATGFAAGAWTGVGIDSAAAAASGTHLVAVGLAANNIGGGNLLYTTFDTASVTASSFLMKYTYYGDANLDGKVDGTDYGLIDNGSLNHLTNWYNGDFNYDGIVNGSDYTLIDNTYHQQDASLAAQVAGKSTARRAAVIADVTGYPAQINSPVPVTVADQIFPADQSEFMPPWIFSHQKLTLPLLPLP